MQNRRRFLKAGVSVAAVGLTGAGVLTGAHRTLAEEAPPETTSLRLPEYPATCLAPLDILDDLLREEGFAEVRYLAGAAAKNSGRAFRTRRSGLRPGFFTCRHCSDRCRRPHGHASWSARWLFRTGRARINS